MIDENSPEMLAALHEVTGFEVDLHHTGGGVNVLRLVAGDGREIWLTREAQWMVGFYDFTVDPEDNGVLVGLHIYAVDNPRTVAEAVARIIDVAGGRRNQGH